MKKTMSTEELSEIASRVATERGFQHGGAVWSTFSDFKVQWQRGLGYIDFRISDYINAGGPEVVESLFRSILDKIHDMTDPEQKGAYADTLLEYIGSAKFRNAKRSSYIRRKHFRNGAGDYFDLNSILSKLISEGLVDDFDVVPVWTDRAVPDHVGFSVLFRTVMIPTDLDDKEMTEEIIRKLLMMGVEQVQRGWAVMCDNTEDVTRPIPCLHLTSEERALVERLS